MRSTEYNTIRDEYLNFPLTQEFFHNLDSDFVYDENYLCIDVLENKKHFSNTLNILQNYITNIDKCFFAIINGPKFIASHKNNTCDETTRTHYGIIVHKNDDGVLNVEKEKYKWVQNESFSFDTKKTHSVYKSKHYKRVILVVDHIKQAT
jgi:aspartyl/asparaginyl beta-hydroxylase (cupin superfamily)